jgi:hypothetical protein
MFKKIAQIEKYKDIISVLFFGITVVLIFIFSSTNNFQISTNFWSNNSFANPSTTLFTSANRTLFNIEYRYVLLILLLILILKSVYKIYCSYNKSKTSIEKLNTLDSNLGNFSYSIFIGLICLVTGLQDISTIIFVLVSSFIGVSFISSSNQERTDKASNPKNRGILLASLSWLLIVIYSVGTLIYGSVRSPWYVYILDLIGLIYFISIVFNNGYWPIKKLKNEDREFVKYGLSLFLKIAFFVVLIIGIHKLV